jgi:hypothetical protein
VGVGATLASPANWSATELQCHYLDDGFPEVIALTADDGRRKAPLNNWIDSRSSRDSKDRALEEHRENNCGDSASIVFRSEVAE